MFPISMKFLDSVVAIIVLVTNNYLVKSEYNLDSEPVNGLFFQVIRLSCPKAGQKSKISIENGKLIFDN